MTAPTDRCLACGCALDMHPRAGACSTASGACDACPCNGFVPAIPPHGVLSVCIGDGDDGYDVRLPAEGWTVADDVPIQIVDWRSCRTSFMIWQPRHGYVGGDDSAPEHYRGEHYTGTFRVIIAAKLAEFGGAR